MARVIRWGILATGTIATTFTKDLVVDPKTRGVEKLVHTVTAAASSSNAARAAEFLGASSAAKAYGSYQELGNDPNVDIICVVTPHSHHYQNVMLCLDAGKNVLCEKAFTVNAAQARILVDKARQRDLFVMEAVWTRYFPLSIYVRELITSGILGNVTRAFADNSVFLDPEKAFADGKHRMVNPDLAGGALLDMGIYSLTWVFQCLYLNQPEEERNKLSSMQKYKPTGVDESTTILLAFPIHSCGDAHSVATASFRVATDFDRKGTTGPAVRVQGDKGEVQIMPLIQRPTKTKLVLHGGTIEEKIWMPPGPGAGSGWKNGFGTRMNPEGVGHGMFWEADEAGFALLEGRKEGRFKSLK